MGGTPADRPLRLQQLFSKAVNDDREKRLLAQLNADAPPLARQTAAAFLSGGNSGGAWLNASPAFPPNRLNNDAFRVALRMRLGVPLADKHQACPHCGGMDDAFGQHAWRCSGLRGAGNTRHTLTNNTVLSVCQHASLTASKEVPYEEHFPRNPNAPADSQTTKNRIDTLVQLPSGTKIVIDVTIRHVTHGSSHEIRGASAAAAEKDKVRFISDRYTIPSRDIIPFALETYGNMGEAAKNFVRSAAKNKAGDNKVAYAQLVNFYRSRIAVAVQRGNLIAINRWLYRRRTAAQGSAGGGSG